jgi:hypothetical protein
MEFINVSGMEMNMVLPNDFSFYEHRIDQTWRPGEIELVK